MTNNQPSEYLTQDHLHIEPQSSPDQLASQLARLLYLQKVIPAPTEGMAYREQLEPTVALLSQIQ